MRSHWTRWSYSVVIHQRNSLGPSSVTNVDCALVHVVRLLSPCSPPPTPGRVDAESLLKEVREVARRQMRLRALSRKIDAAIAPPAPTPQQLQQAAAGRAGAGASGGAQQPLSMRGWVVVEGGGGSARSVAPPPPGSSGGGGGVPQAGPLSYPTLQQRSANRV